MDPSKYKKTWVANKSIYRTRMAIADGGRLVVIAPGVSRFGEHDDVDGLIRKYGYRTTPEVVDMVSKNADLRANLSTAAHLIHASPENRFRVEYCTDKLSKEELESVGYFKGAPDEAMREYNVNEISDGWHTSRSGESSTLFVTLVLDFGCTRIIRMPFKISQLCTSLPLFHFTERTNLV